MPCQPVHTVDVNDFKNITCQERCKS